MKLEEIKKMNIPLTPGCYLFKDVRGRIVYIGKASKLRNRILSYWRKKTDHSPAKFSMMKKVGKIEIIETDSEIEALLLEANLIKKHSPEYNVIMRDDKRYAYIKISTGDEYPRVHSTRKLERSGRYFGPFVSAEAVRETLKVIRKIWPFRSCKNMPSKTCLYYRIGKCPGMCEKHISKSDYQKIIRHIKLFLEGKKGRIVKSYETRIRSLEKRRVLSGSEEEEFGLLKYRLFNMKKVLDHSNVLSLMDKYAMDVVELAKVLSLPRVPGRIEGYDISNIQGRYAVGSMVVFQDGEPDKNEYRKFKIRDTKLEGDTYMLKEVLERRFKHSLASGHDEGQRETWSLPDLVIVDGGKAQLNMVSKILKNNKLNIPALSISKGEGLRSAKAPDKIFFPGERKPLELPLASPALHVIKRVRDEAHRFAIGYHRKLRSRHVIR